MESARAFVLSSSRRRAWRSSCTISGTRSPTRAAEISKHPGPQYVHVRQEAQDRAMDAFDQGQNISEDKRWSSFRPVDSAEMRDNAGSAGMSPGGLNNRKIN